MMKELDKMTKPELIEHIETLMANLKDCRVRHVEDWKKATRDIETLQTKLDKSEAYVEQGRAMIEAVMERWDEYDV